MQPPKKYKFLQEQVFEGTWPFKLLKSPFNVLLLLLIYFIWGLTLYLLYDIPLNYLLAGICGAFGLFLWTISIFRYADNLRNVEIEHLNRVSKKFHVGFLENLFHPSSIVISILVFVLVLTYFYSSTSIGIENLLTYIQREMELDSLPPLLVFYILLMAFDICYRLGLSLYVILIQLKRDFLLAHYLRDPLLRAHFSATDIRNLEKSDLVHFLAISSGITLLSLGILDPFLFIMVLSYILFTFSISVVNILYLRLLYIRAIPDGLLTLIWNSNFAQVGTISTSITNTIPHVTPTLFVFDGRNFFISTSFSSKKVRNLRKINEISLFIDSQKNMDISRSFGVHIQGKSKIYGYNTKTGLLFFFLFAPILFRVSLLFLRKYPNYISYYQKTHRIIPRAWQIFPIISRTIIEIEPKQFFAWKASRSKQIRF